jgi:predicted Zn-dependent protease
MIDFAPFDETDDGQHLALARRHNVGMVTPISPEAGLAEAIAAYNSGRHAQAEVLCAQLLQRFGNHPAIDQLAAVLAQERGDAAAARRHIDRCLTARPGHEPSLMVLSLVAQDQRDLATAEAALLQVLTRQPAHVAAAVNLGIVHLEQGRLADAMARFGQAFRQRPETFGRIANALSSSATGALWLDREVLREALRSAA